MSEYVKPWVYNPRTAEKRIQELEADISSLERIITTQKSTIDTYQQIFLLQEAEIKRLKGGAE